jgi:hypothetical protein
MRGNKNLGLIILIILILLTIAIYRINSLVLKQLDQTGTLQQSMPVEAPQQAKEEAPKPPPIIEGIVIEGQPPSPAMAPEPLLTPVKNQKNMDIINEPSSDTPILVQ